MNNENAESFPLQRRQNKDNRKYPVYPGAPIGDYENERDEKPWQRVLFEIRRKGTHLYEPVKSVPSTLIILVLGTYLLLAYLTQLVEDDMPRVVNETDVARDNTDTFSEEAAWRYLYQIMGESPRVCGTRYHLQKTRDMKDLVDTVAASANTPVRTDWQFATGDYWLNYTAAHVNCYQNVSNIIAVLEGESGFNSDGSTGTSLLVNCHYDSVPYALGASDNVIFCAAMVEALSKLSRRNIKFKHNIVFLFNGAEENPLQASHAFLKHPWSRGVTNVVNLDAAGMNGKPNLFQVSDPRVLAVYRRTVRSPSAQSFGEFLFASGLIPSDTDFRIWRDFGHFYGVDIAFAKWGHVYHTRYDHPDLVLPGVVQQAGDMLLAMVAELADTHDLKDQMAPTAAVYYDYLNTFLVTYSLAAAHAVDALVAVFALASVAYYVWLVGPRWSTVQELLLCALGRGAALGAGLLAALVLVPVMVATTTQLRYLTQPWIVVPIFWMPYLLAAVAASQAFDSWRTKKSGLNRSIRTLQAMAATRLLLALVTLVMVCVPALVTMRYIITVPLFIMSTMSLVSLTLIRYIKMQAWRHLILEVVLSLPSAMFLLTLALRIDALMLPVLGRTPSPTPDYTAAVLNVGLAALVPVTVSGIELLFSRRRLWVVMSAVSAACVIIMFIPMSPYSDDGPSVQRHYWFHTEIVSYERSGSVSGRTSGVLVTPHDVYTTRHVAAALRDRGLALNVRTDFDEDCRRYVYCNLPLYRTRFGEFLRSSIFLYTGPPAPFQPAPTVQLSTSVCGGLTCTYNFVMTGPPHNMITVWPHANVSLASWSFSMPVQHSFTQLERPAYVIVQSTATYSDVLEPLTFSLTFTVPLSLQSQPIMDLSHHAHKIHHPEDYTSEFRNLVNAMPAYINIANFMTIRSNYVF